jgi:hypothetical protein
VKARLKELVAESARQPTLIRVACRDLESWVAGDWQALAEAFDRPQLIAQSSKEAFRNADALARPVEALRKLIPDYQKRDGARRVGKLIDPARNQRNCSLRLLRWGRCTRITRPARFAASCSPARSITCTTAIAQIVKSW